MKAIPNKQYVTQENSNFLLIFKKGHLGKLYQYEFYYMMRILKKGISRCSDKDYKNFLLGYIFLKSPLLTQTKMCII